MVTKRKVSKRKKPTELPDSGPGSDFRFVIWDVADLSTAPCAAEDPGAVGVGETDQDARADGCHLAGRGLLASSEQIEDALLNLRECLAAGSGRTEERTRRKLLEAWIAVQLCLPEDEVQDLRLAFEKAMFGQAGTPSPSSGSTAQGGGHRQCR